MASTERDAEEALARWFARTRPKTAGAHTRPTADGTDENATPNAPGGENDARASASGAASTSGMDSGEEYALFALRFSKLDWREATASDASALAYFGEKIRTAFVREFASSLPEDDDGGWVKRISAVDWRDRFSKMTPADVKAAVEETQTILTLMNRDAYRAASGERGGAGGELELREHSAAPRAECPFCKRTFTRAHLPKHVASKHTGARPFVCTYSGCGETFADKKAMKRHVAVVHEFTYKCTEPGCGNVFSTKQMLQQHVNQKHSLYPKFRCPHPGCGQAFKYEKTLTEHFKRKHTEERPHECTFPGCTETFVAKGDLTRHHRTHFGLPARAKRQRTKVNRHLALEQQRVNDPLVNATSLPDPASISRWLFSSAE